PRENTFLYRVHELVRRRSFDIVHDHSGSTGILLAALLGHPGAVATLHTAVSGPQCDFLAEVDDVVRLVGISHSQQARCLQVDWTAMVYNAVDPTEYRPVFWIDGKGAYVIQLDGLSPQ